MGVVIGFHHVIANTTDVDRSRRFYVGILGLQEANQTVSFDEPSILQLYFAASSSKSSPCLSLLHRPAIVEATRGTGQISNIVFSIAAGSEPLWLAHLRNSGVQIDGRAWAFGQKLLCFTDPDGLKLAVTEIGSTSVDKQLRVGCIVSIEILLRGFEHLARLLSDVLLFQRSETDGPATRLKALTHESSFAVDLVSAPTCTKGQTGRGVAEYLMLRVPLIADLVSLRSKLVTEGFDVTPVLDRLFYQAIYFSGPENISIGIATEVQVSTVGPQSMA